MIAGVGKSYRMLQEAHEMLENGVDVHFLLCLPFVTLSYWQYNNFPHI